MKPPENKQVKQGNKPLKPESKLAKLDSRAPHTLASGNSRLDDDLDEDFDDALDFDANGIALEPIPVAAPSADSKPNPVELPAPINPEGGRKQSVEMHRNLFCLHYDNCLDEAV